MVRKAQIEPIAILGLIFVGVIVIYFAYQSINVSDTPTAPIGISEEQKALRLPIENLMKTAAEEALRDIEFQGGFTVAGSPDPMNPPDVPGVKYFGRGVKYWTMCEQYDELVPDFDDDIKPNIRLYIERVIRYRVGKVIESSYSNAEVGLNDLDVDIDFSDMNMMVTVTLPVTIEDYSLSPKYIINIPTRILRLYEFARDFSIEQSTERNMEAFTISSIGFSPDLLTFDVLATCGDVAIQTPFDVKEGLENAITYTLTSGNINFWETLDEGATEVIGKYFIPSVNGIVYDDLDVYLGLPDDFEIAPYGEPTIIMNNEFLTLLPIPIPICITAFRLGYDVVYPFVVTTKDDLSGNDFNFASLVCIDSNDNIIDTGEENSGMIPANYGDIDLEEFSYDDDEAYNCECAETKYAQASIEDTNGPVTDASVVFGRCVLTHQGEGIYKGEIPCEISDDIVVYKDGYGLIKDYTIVTRNFEPSFIFTLHRIPTITFHLHEVEIIEDSETGDISCNIKEPTSIFTPIIKEIDYNPTEYPLTPNLDGDKSKDCFELVDQDSMGTEIEEDCGCTGWATFWGTCTSEDVADCAWTVFSDHMLPVETCILDNDALDNEITANYIPGSYEYFMDVSSRDIQGFAANGGGLEIFWLGEDDADMHIYVPTKTYPRGTFDLYDVQKSTLSSIMEENCGIEFVSATEY